MMSVPTAAVKAASSTDIAGKFAKEGQAKTEASRFSDAPPMQRQLCDLKQQTSPFGFLYNSSDSFELEDVIACVEGNRCLEVLEYVLCS